MNHLTTRFFLLLMATAGAVRLPAQTFPNGSFEINQVDSCAINMKNELFTASMAYATAFGNKDEVDVLTGNCGYGPAADGDFFIALNSLNNYIDQVSLELEEPLVAGKRYAFTFFQKKGEGGFTDEGVLLGLSNTADQFGQPIYQSRNLSEAWTENYVEFVAPFQARYLTVRANPNNYSWVFLDHFARVCPRAISLGSDTLLCKAAGFTLGLDDSFDTYRWQDNSSQRSYVVNEPGLYWVEVTIDDCILSDSILIGELPYNCECRIYVPSAFSPNGDGINETFGTATPCRLLSYELSVFDRWGSQVFTTRDPAATWDGASRGQGLGTGVYLYFLKYQFEYQPEVQLQTGEVTLVRD